ncbi:MAG: bile acid:sodium symporter [Candidatus Sedimenticola sp. (ex Thyasira tokunagai)]
MIIAFAFAWLSPEPGALLKEQGLIPWMVVTIFLVNGYQTRLHQLAGQSRLIKTLLIAIVINLILSPLIGFSVASLINLSAGATLGLILVASVPTTLSSAIVLTRIAGGDAVKALMLTILLNLIGVFSLPFTLQLLLEGGGIIELSPWPLLQKLMLIVLLPFFIGMVVRELTNFSSKNILLSYLPSLCVLGTVWMSMSASTETLKTISLQEIGLIVLASAVIHTALLLLGRLSRLLHPSERTEWLALLFTASQKTLPLAIAALTALDRSTGPALVACILFHFVQLFQDSLLASKLRQV